MANWSLCGRHAGPDKSPTAIFINLDNVLTVERQGDLTAVVMVGGEKVSTLTQCQRRSSGRRLLLVLYSDGQNAKERCSTHRIDQRRAQQTRSLQSHRR
jgi:hypothetical protein